MIFSDFDEQNWTQKKNGTSSSGSSGTGNKGSEDDLAGLVCNKLGDHQCINPKKGMDGGDTWAKRLEDLDKKSEETDVNF